MLGLMSDTGISDTLRLPMPIGAVVTKNRLLVVPKSQRGKGVVMAACGGRAGLKPAPATLTSNLRIPFPFDRLRANGI